MLYNAKENKLVCWWSKTFSSQSISTSRSSLFTLFVTLGFLFFAFQSHGGSHKHLHFPKFCPLLSLSLLNKEKNWTLAKRKIYSGEEHEDWRGKFTQLEKRKREIDIDKKEQRNGFSKFVIQTQQQISRHWRPQKRRLFYRYSLFFAKVFGWPLFGRLSPL